MTSAQFNETKCASCFGDPQENLTGGCCNDRVNPAGYIEFAGSNQSGLYGDFTTQRGNFSWLVQPGTYYLWLQGVGNTGPTVDDLDWTCTISFANYE